MARKKISEKTMARRKQKEEDVKTKRLLDPYWDRGMKSTKSNLIPSAMLSTNLSEEVIKRYIMHKKKRVKRQALKDNGQLPPRKKKDRQKKTRAYDKCVSVRMKETDLEGLTQGEKFKIAIAHWNSLGTEDMAYWKEQARIENISYKKPRQDVKKSVKIIKEECKKLWSLGVMANVLLPPMPDDDEIKVDYHPRMEKFWTSPLALTLFKGFAKELSQYNLAPWEVLENQREGTSSDFGQDVQIENVQVQEPDGASAGATRDVQSEDAEDVEELERPMVDSTPEHDDPVAPSDANAGSPRNEPTEEEGTCIAVVQVPIIPGDGEAPSSIIFSIPNSVVPNGEADVVTEPQMTMDKALAKAQEIISQKEQKKTKRPRKPRKKKDDLIGRKITQLWEMGRRRPRKWFDGIIKDKTEDVYNIHYDDRSTHSMTEIDIKKAIEENTFVMK